MDTNTALVLATYPRTSEDVLYSLRNHHDAKVLLAVAQHGNTRSDTLRVLSGSTDIDVLTAVASNPRTPYLYLWKAQKAIKELQNN